MLPFTYPTLNLDQNLDVNIYLGHYYLIYVQ